MELELNVAASFYTSNVENNREGWSIRIEDEASGMTLADVQMRADDFLTVMRGGQVCVTGRVADALDRVGKKMNVWNVPVPRAVTEGIYDPEVQTEMAREWGERNAAQPYDTLEVRHTNAGMVIYYRKWESQS